MVIKYQINKKWYIINEEYTKKILRLPEEKRIPAVKKRYSLAGTVTAVFFGLKRITN